MDKLAKEQLHPAGPSQALLNCCDAVVDKLHLYGDVCIVHDRVYYDHSCRVCFLLDILGCLTSACLGGPCILVRQTDVTVLVYSSSVHLGLLIPSSRRLNLWNGMSSTYDLQAHCNEIANTCLRVNLSTDTMFYTCLCGPTRLETPKGCETNVSIFINH